LTRLGFTGNLERCGSVAELSAIESSVDRILYRGTSHVVPQVIVVEKEEGGKVRSAKNAMT
jgi:hypothetical protein